MQHMNLIYYFLSCAGIDRKRRLIGDEFYTTTSKSEGCAKIAKTSVIPAEFTTLPTGPGKTPLKRLTFLSVITTCCRIA